MFIRYLFIIVRTDQLLSTMNQALDIVFSDLLIRGTFLLYDIGNSWYNFIANYDKKDYLPCCSRDIYLGPDYAGQL